MKGEIIMDIKVKCTRTGREWKTIGKGLEHLDDNKVYRLEFHADTVIKAIRVWVQLKRKKPFIMTYSSKD